MGRKKDDRHLGALPNLPAPVIAIVKGQTNIQQDHMRGKGLELRHHRVKIPHIARPKAPFLQLFCQNGGNGHIIFDNQNIVHGPS